MLYPFWYTFLLTFVSETNTLRIRLRFLLLSLLYFPLFLLENVIYFWYLQCLSPSLSTNLHIYAWCLFYTPNNIRTYLLEFFATPLYSVCLELCLTLPPKPALPPDFSVFSSDAVLFPKLGTLEHLEVLIIKSLVPDLVSCCSATNTGSCPFAAQPALVQ